MTATLPPPEIALTTDRVGAVENAGVEYLPEDARDSRPRNLGAVFLGANLTWTNVVFGAFAILFGLSFWQTVTSMAVGIAVGTLAVAAHRDHRAAHRHQHDGVQRRVLRHPRPVHRVGHRAAHRVRIRRGDGVDERRRDRRRRAPAARYSGQRRGARDRIRGRGGADGDRCAVRPRDHRRDAEGRGPRRRGADDPRRVRVRGRVRSRCVERRLRAGWLLADVGAVGRAVRGGADLVRADDRRLHAPNLRPAVQQSAHLRCAGRRHVRRCAAAQPVRRVHRDDVRRIRPTPISTIWSRPRPVGMCCRSWSSRCWAG